MRSLRAWALGLLCGVAACAQASDGPETIVPVTRLSRIQQRGALNCGVEAVVPGFVEVDSAGRYRGLDVDICRALAAAIVGSADNIRFIATATIADFRANDEIDLVSRRLTWELQREAPLGILFGPVTFYDGQTFLVSPSLRARAAEDLAGHDVCVAGGTVFESRLTSLFAGRHLPLRKVIVDSAHQYDDIAQALATGRCPAYTGDESDLGVIRSRLRSLGSFLILPTHISKEPLAPLVREDDTTLFNAMKWTIFALIEAEELKVTAANVDAMRASPDVDVQRLLGVVPGNGKALGLDELWAARAISAVGNYGEMFERNVGTGSAVRLERGLNRLQRDGGLMFAMPLR